MKTNTTTVQRQDFPHLFQTLEPPGQLFVRSQNLNILQDLPNQALAIVGTRHPEARTKNFVRRFIHGLRSLNVILVSGGARGIDTEVHRAALDYGLRTVSVIATGLDVHYPIENQNLQKEILESGGATISEYSSRTQARPYFFLKRNRLIAGWSSAVVIAQAPQRSGALNTASWAIQMGIPTFSVPSFPEEKNFAGGNGLLETGPTLPLMNVRSLGSIWMAASTLGAAPIDNHPILKEIQRQEIENGAAHFQSILGTFLEKNHSPKWFYEELHQLQKKKKICESGGWLSIEP